MATSLPWGHADRSRIDVEDQGDVRYWTETLDVDEATLRGALQAVGDASADVRDYLQIRKATHA